jgi:16S rRNA (adenine1518-N6/adenine1519-N6)-dimethyltransferase
MNHNPGWQDPRKILARYGLAPKKRYSQNFLISPNAIDAIAAAAVERQGQVVVELGAGLGTLTAALVRLGARVYAVERDRELIAVLREEFADQQVQVIDADAATLDLQPIAIAAGQKPVVAGNIPYAITGAIIRQIIASKQHLDHAVLTIQREVSERLQAIPGTKAYGVLTIFASAAFDIKRIRRIPATAFFPRPKVDSEVVRLEPLARPRALETAQFVALVHAAFQQRRKTLRNALLSIAPSAQQLDRSFAQAEIDSRRRGETLSVEEFARLAHHWGES